MHLQRRRCDEHSDYRSGPFRLHDAGGQFRLCRCGRDRTTRTFGQSGSGVPLQPARGKLFARDLPRSGKSGELRADPDPFTRHSARPGGGRRACLRGHGCFRLLAGSGPDGPGNDGNPRGEIRSQFSGDRRAARGRDHRFQHADHPPADRSAAAVVCTKCRGDRDCRGEMGARRRRVTENAEARSDAVGGQSRLHPRERRRSRQSVGLRRRLPPE